MILTIIDAITFKQASGTSYVIGGGARNADDKIMQFNGRGTVVVRYFFASNFGKVVSATAIILLPAR